MTYKPVIAIDGIEPEDVLSVEKLLQDNECSYVESMDGQVWRIFPWLNRKSVSINDATSHNPQRLVWAKVKSFGVIEESRC